MIVLEKPYVSDFLIDTIQKNNFYVLETPFSKIFSVSMFLSL